MAATASDVLCFFDAVMTRKIINEKSFESMIRFTRALHPEDMYLESFGSGLFRYGDVCRDTIGHLGLFIGSEAAGLFSLEEKFTIVLLANISRIENRDAILQKYLDRIVRQDGV